MSHSLKILDAFAATEQKQQLFLPICVSVTRILGKHGNKWSDSLVAEALGTSEMCVWKQCLCLCVCVRGKRLSQWCVVTGTRVYLPSRQSWVRLGLNASRGSPPLQGLFYLALLFPGRYLGLCCESARCVCARTHTWLPRDGNSCHSHFHQWRPESDCTPSSQLNLQGHIIILSNY